MPSVSFQLPVAIILLGGGIVASFAGYRLLRILLAAYGFIAGAALATILAGPLDLWLALLAALAGGLAGAALALAVYLAGVALLGASLAAFLVHLAVDGDPNTLILLTLSLTGALAALIARRTVLIVATAFLGGWATLVGLFALSQQDAALAATAGDLSGLFPLSRMPGQSTFTIGWLALGVVGAIVQFRTGSPPAAPPPTAARTTKRATPKTKSDEK